MFQSSRLVMAKSRLTIGINTVVHQVCLGGGRCLVVGLRLTRRQISAPTSSLWLKIAGYTTLYLHEPNILRVLTSANMSHQSG